MPDAGILNTKPMSMERDTPYIISNYEDSNGYPTWIAFVPYPNQYGKTLISVEHGANRNLPQGPCLEPKEMLEFVMGKSIWKDIDGKSRYIGNEYEPPGWFHRQCLAAGCLWFYAIVERIAAGEGIPIEAIKAAYRENNEGKELEQKPIRELV